MSSQVKSDGGGGGGRMKMSGYEESQAVSFVSYCSCGVGDDSFSFAFSGSFTTSAHSAGIIACSTSSPAANSADAATCAFYD
jgi:hypothetical protein